MKHGEAVRILEGCASTAVVMSHASAEAQLVGGRRNQRTDTGVDDDEQLIASPRCARGKQLACA